VCSFAEGTTINEHLEKKGMPLKRRFGAVVVALACLGRAAQSASAAITPDTQILFSGSNSDYLGTISQTLANDPTSVWFKYTGTTLRADMWNLDEESDWYLANAGQIFSPGTIAAQQFTKVFTIDSPAPAVTISVGDFFLAVNTGTGFAGGKPGRNVFGWVKIHNTGTTLTAVSSAVAYGEPGIMIGSTTPVQEPATLLLAPAAVALLLCRRQR
jgi:hypothetical protein